MLKKRELLYNGFGKSLIDVSRVSYRALSRRATSVHRPLGQLCRRGSTKYEESVLRVHHYKGSWESYSSKSDVRRSRVIFDEAAHVSAGQNYDLQPWLNAFVEKMGIDDAKVLLQGAGLEGQHPIHFQ